LARPNAALDFTTDFPDGQAPVASRKRSQCAKSRRNCNSYGWQHSQQVILNSSDAVHEYARSCGCLVSKVNGLQIGFQFMYGECCDTESDKIGLRAAA